MILPITDPYVVHHGALGSFATVHVGGPRQPARPADVAAVLAALAATPGVAEVHDRTAGCARFELPPDRVGDVVVVAETPVVLGKSPAEHDLSLLKEPLRSHGGVSEERVPFVINRPLTAAYAARAGDLRNFDMFDYVLNGVTPA